jgi:hypothetical protein
MRKTTLLLCDISHHVNDLNIKLQGQHKLIFYMSVAARAFEMKLKLFRKQLENVNLCHFFFCDLLYEYVSASVPFQNARAVEMINSLAENFKMRFSDIRSHVKNIRIFEHAFSFEVGDVPE